MERCLLKARPWQFGRGGRSRGSSNNSSSSSSSNKNRRPKFVEALRALFKKLQAAEAVEGLPKETLFCWEPAAAPATCSTDSPSSTGIVDVVPDDESQSGNVSDCSSSSVGSSSAASSYASKSDSSATTPTART